MSTLEDKCHHLSMTVDNLNLQLDKSLRNENELHDKVGDLSQTLQLRDSHGHQTEERLASLERALDRIKIEKDVLQDQLEAAQGSNKNLKQRILALEHEVEEAEAALQKSESKVNQLELTLQVGMNPGDFLWIPGLRCSGFSKSNF